MTQVGADLDNGVVVHQVTDGPALVDDIYCERSYCTPDSRYFVFQRYGGPGGDYDWKHQAEYIACEFGTWETRTLGRGISYPEISQQGSLYYVCPTDGGQNGLVRVDVATGESQAIDVDGGVKPITGMTVCPAERHIAYGVHLSDDPLMFGVELVDLHSGAKRIVCRHSQICNPHLQFEPGQGRHILIQQNLGCRADTVGWVSGSGATLFVLTVEDGAITPLEVGPPYTAKCSGHQQWIGSTRQVLATLLPDKHTVGAEDTLVAVGMGAPARAVSRDFWGHVHTSRCGRYYCCDNGLTGGVFVGSITTGRYMYICDASPRTDGLSKQFGQKSDAHAYLSPDLRWMVFQSCQSGRPQIHVASIPPELLEGLNS
jgi:hypothetical protein